MSWGRVKEYLKQEGVGFTQGVRGWSTVHHGAIAGHNSGAAPAETVVFRTEAHFVMAVVPAGHGVDLERLRAKLGVSSLRLADESELAALFPDVEAGAEPPFGNLYDVPVYVDTCLTTGNRITFHAGTRQGAISMEYDDFARLVNPFVFSFSVPKERVSAGKAIVGVRFGRLEEAIAAAVREARAAGEPRYVHCGMAGFVVLKYRTPGTVTTVKKDGQVMDAVASPPQKLRAVAR